MPWLLAAAFAVLYATTFTSRYYHDSALFVTMVESGKWGYSHLFYLPCAHVIRLVASLFVDCDAERALEIFAVLTAAATVGVATAFARRLTDGNALAAGTAGILTGLAPTVWFGGVHLEIHLFSGLGVLLATWLAWAAPLRARVGGRDARTVLAVALAALLAPSFHLSALFMTGGLVFAGLAGAHARGERPGFGAVVVHGIAAGVGLVLNRVALSFVSPSEVGSPLVNFLQLMVRIVTDVELLTRNVTDQWLIPYGVLAAGPIVALAWRRGRPAWFAWVVVGGFVPSLLFAITIKPMEGQYLLIALPFLVLPIATALAAAPRRVAIAIAVGAIALQLAHAIPQYRRLSSIDADRDWARAAAESIDGPAFVICPDEIRMRYVMRYSGQPALNICALLLVAPPAEVARVGVERFRSALADGTNVYFDQWMWSDHPELCPKLAETLRLLEPFVEIDGGSGTVRRLVRLKGG